MAVPTNTILGYADAPVSAQWHSENESVQARTAALVACGDSDSGLVAGLATRAKDQGMHTNFVWDGPYPEEVVPLNDPMASSTEYRDKFVDYPSHEVIIFI